MSEVIDLDALAPSDVVIRFGGQEISVKPPTVADVLRLGSLGQQMTKIDKLNNEETQKLTDDLTAHVKKIIPELADKDLSSYQLLKLVAIINEMSVPPEAKELQDRGITPNTDPKAE